MTGCHSRGKQAKNKDFRKSIRTRRYQRDIDQIYDDLKPGNIEKIVSQKLDEDLPGMGQFYCVSCAKYFINQESKLRHTTSKDHKRRVKALQEEPYTIADSRRFGGVM